MCFPIRVETRLLSFVEPRAQPDGQLRQLRTFVFKELDFIQTLYEATDSPPTPCCSR